MPYEDCQSFFNVLTQISPAFDTLGWKIFVANQPTTEKNQYMSQPPEGTLRQTLWRCCWELLSELELDSKIASSVRGSLCRQ